MINQVIRDHMQKRHGVANTLTDQQLEQRIAAMIGEGEIGVGEYAELLREANEWDRRQLESSRQQLAGTVSSVVEDLSQQPLPVDVDDRIQRAIAKHLSVPRPTATGADGGSQHTPCETDVAADLSQQGLFHQPKEGNSMSTSVTANDVLNLAAETDSIRVKNPSEHYSSVKSVGKHVRTGQPVRYRGREAETPSQLENAKAGAFLKYLGARAGINVSMSEHERLLLDETINKDRWCGKVGTEWHVGLQGEHVKALLDDSTSGGQEISPEWFDDALVSFPLLNSEILPEVDLRDVPRSTSVEGAAVGNPSVTWGTAEGSSLSLFNTANLVSELNTTIHPVAVGIEVGNDFLSDAAVNVGDTLLQNIGQRMLQELDRVVVAGDGSSEPQGIVNASGVVDITAQTPTTGPLTYDDALNLSFGVAKQYRAPGFRPCFVMTDTSYKRFRSIATGVTGDSRPLFGMNVKSYELVEYPVKIEQTGLTNNQIVFGALQKYRLYRRQGVESRFTREGQTLTLKNTSLLYVRGRFGGRVVDGSAFAVMDSAPA